MPDGDMVPCLLLADDLIVRAACVIRLEEETVVEPISTAALQDYCTSRELSTTGSKDQLLDRGCNYQSKELIDLIEPVKGTEITE